MKPYEVMSQEILPCPFCGRLPTISKSMVNYNDGKIHVSKRYYNHYIKCSIWDGCGIAGTHGYMTPEEAIAIWNKRVTTDEKGE